MHVRIYLLWSYIWVSLYTDESLSQDMNEKHHCPGEQNTLVFGERRRDLYVEWKIGLVLKLNSWLVRKTQYLSGNIIFGRF